MRIKESFKTKHIFPLLILHVEVYQIIDLLDKRVLFLLSWQNIIFNRCGCYGRCCNRCCMRCHKIKVIKLNLHVLIAHYYRTLTLLLSGLGILYYFWVMLYFLGFIPNWCTLHPLWLRVDMWALILHCTPFEWVGMWRVLYWTSFTYVIWYYTQRFILGVSKTAHIFDALRIVVKLGWAWFCCNFESF